MEAEIIKKLKDEGYNKVYVYDAPAGEIDEEHQHDFDTKLIVLEGQIEITAPINGKVETLSHSTGSHIEIPRNTHHSAKAGPTGCRYVVAEKYENNSR